MLKKPLLIEAIVLLALSLTLNQIATEYHLYWLIEESDSIVHFLSGATLSVFFLWLYFFSGFFNPQKRSLAKFLAVSLLGSMLVAFSWEIYELIFQKTMVQRAEYPFDTVLDIVMGFLGALAACFYGYLKETKSPTPNPSPY